MMRLSLTILLEYRISGQGASHLYKSRKELLATQPFNIPHRFELPTSPHGFSFRKLTRPHYIFLVALELTLDQTVLKFTDVSRLPPSIVFKGKYLYT